MQDLTLRPLKCKKSQGLLWGLNLSLVCPATFYALWSLTYSLWTDSVTWQVKGVAKALNTNLEEGVEDSPEELQKRKDAYGDNTYPRKRPKGFLVCLLNHACGMQMSHFAKNSSTDIMGFSKTETIISLCFGRRRFFGRHARTPLSLFLWWQQ